MKKKDAKKNVNSDAKKSIVSLLEDYIGSDASTKANIYQVLCDRKSEAEKTKGVHVIKSGYTEVSKRTKKKIADYKVVGQVGSKKFYPKADQVAFILEY